MEEIKDTYKTLHKPSPVSLFKDKGSKFLGHAFPVHSEEIIRNHLERLRKEHHSARHWCYAWQLNNNEYNIHRVNDDGEPKNSAGAPIYGQIRSFGLTNILIVVVRYFGGTKLGVGGLIKAYRNAAQMALESASIIEYSVQVVLELRFAYPEMNKVMRIIKEENLIVTSQQLVENCTLHISVRKKEVTRIVARFKTLHTVVIKKQENGDR